ncbi:MAG TPA: hypothetical protein VF013_06730 [Candidatus Limnocylindria bacterium]
MLRNERLPRSGSTDRVSDLELGIAAVLVGVVVLLATILVPLIG